MKAGCHDILLLYTLLHTGICKKALGCMEKIQFYICVEMRYTKGEKELQERRMYCVQRPNCAGQCTF